MVKRFTVQFGCRVCVVFAFISFPSDTLLVFRDLLPLSNKLNRLIQDQLLEAPRTNTLEDVRTTIETLSTFTSACESVLKYVSIKGEKTDLETAVEMVENVLLWEKCLS